VEKYTLAYVFSFSWCIYENVKVSECVPTLYVHVNACSQWVEESHSNNRSVVFCGWHHCI